VLCNQYRPVSGDSEHAALQAGFRFNSVRQAVGPRQAGTQPQGRGREAQGGGGEMVGVELVGGAGRHKMEEAFITSNESQRVITVVAQKHLLLGPHHLQ